MSTAYEFAALQSTDQWRRVAHENTALLTDIPGITLNSRDTPADRAQEPCDEVHRPLAFDPWCRLYRLHVESGNVQRWRWASDQGTGAVEKDGMELVEKPPGLPGEFEWLDDRQTPLGNPKGMTIDAGGRLFVAESDADRLHVFDLVDRRLLRTVFLPAGSRPTAMASSGEDVFVITNSGMLRLSAFADPLEMPLPDLAAGVNRIAAIENEVVGLTNAGSVDSRVVSLTHENRALSEPFATDLVFLDDRHLVVARGCDRSFLQFRFLPLSWADRPLLVKRLRAKGYDGRGIVATHDQRIGYFSSKGFKTALRIKQRFETQGRVVTFALDSGVFQNQWGIAHIDACVPELCDVHINFHASDELPEFHIYARPRAQNDGGFGELPFPELSDPMPDQHSIARIDEERRYRLYRRGENDEFVWDEAITGKSVTYECPVHAGPGRYLWLTLELTGTGRRAPAINAVRVQKLGHNLLSHLPRLYSRDDAVSSFLRRYLAIPDSLQSYLHTAALYRHALLDPCSSPTELLPWLAGFVGLVLDERFSEDVRRRLIEAAVWLFRFRGTVEGLTRFLGIYLGVQVVIFEHFKVRGLGGALVGAEHPEEGNAVLGAGYRVGLALGEESSSIDEELPQSGTTSDDRHAHRFTILIPALLSSERSDVVNLIVSRHRPAHTSFDICTVEAGMRISRGLHLELTSIVGHSGGFSPLQADGSYLGRGTTVGSAAIASTASSGRIDINARLG